MKVAVWGINYAPEVTGIAPYNVALCRYLKDAGHDVRMVTTFSYYPTWKKLPEDAGRLYRTDVIDGVPVHRCWHYVPAKPSALKRIIHEATFITTSWLRLLFLPRADVYFVASPPLMLGFAAWFLTLFKRAPFVFHVQDLQPDAAVGLGMLKPGLLTKILYWLEAFAYRKAALVSGISAGMMKAFERKGVPKSKSYLFFNGVDVEEKPAKALAGLFRRSHGLSSDAFLAVYSGNLGVKQGLGILLDAAGLLNQGAVCIVICGDGAERSQLEATAKARGLGNVIFLPLPTEGKVSADAARCRRQSDHATGRDRSVFLPQQAPEQSFRRESGGDGRGSRLRIGSRPKRRGVRVQRAPRPTRPLGQIA